MILMDRGYRTYRSLVYLPNVFFSFLSSILSSNVSPQIRFKTDNPATCTLYSVKHISLDSGSLHIHVWKNKYIEKIVMLYNLSFSVLITYG